MSYIWCNNKTVLVSTDAIEFIDIGKFTKNSDSGQQAILVDDGHGNMVPEVKEEDVRYFVVVHTPTSGNNLIYGKGGSLADAKFELGRLYFKLNGEEDVIE